jgi:hypothetical protein
MRNSNSCTPNNKTKNHNHILNEEVKIYFPSISIQVLQNALHGIPNPNKKQKQTQNKTQLDKYLYSDTQKTMIYGTTSILEIFNNEPYPVYPSDKMIITSSIPCVSKSVVSKNQNQHQHQNQHQQLQLLVDYSSMKRSQKPSYQIPYEFKIHSYVVKKYKMNPKSNTSFVIEYKDNNIHDFYVLAKLSRTPLGVGTGMSTNRIEIDNFIKEDIISFLLILNLY